MIGVEVTELIWTATASAVLGGLGTAACLAWARRRRRSVHGCNRDLAALAAAAESLSRDDPDQSIPAVLGAVGGALGCDHLLVEEFHPLASNGTPMSSLRHEWNAPNRPERRADPARKNRSWMPARVRWHAELKSGRCIAGSVQDLPLHERELLQADGISAIVLAPVVACGRLWGVLSCEDVAGQPRNEQQVTGLRTLAVLLGGCITRAGMKTEMSVAHQEAEAGSRAKREFLANISHEVRTPLNGVLGMAGLLLDTELNRDQREYAQVVRTSAENLLTLLNDLLDLAKVETGAMAVERVRFDPRRMGEDVLQLVTERAQGKGLEVACRVDDAVPRRVIGDPTRIRQVLVNLLGNAVKFTTRGHVIMRVSFRLRPDGQGDLAFAVEDTGIGITSEDLGRLFHPFVQGDGTTTRRFGGSGLGLAICHRLAEVMSGRVVCDSTPGIGSTFVLSVPVQESSSTGMGRTNLLPDQLIGKPTLVVEGEPAIREAFCEQCRRIGLVATGVASAAEALAVIQSGGANCPRLVLVSANLPGAADLPHRAGLTVPMILLAPSTRRPTGAEASTLGFAASIAKPPRTPRLAEAAGRALSSLPETEDDTTRFQRGPRMMGRVLVVEDDAINQQLAVAILAREGWSADVAGNGHEALEALARGRYDAILMDLLMPVMDGFEAANAIRGWEQDRGQQRVPIIAISAVDDPDARARSLAAGMDDHLRKPFDPKALRRLLRRWTGNAQAEAAG